MIGIRFNRGRTYRAIKVLASPWHVDMLALGRSQRDKRLFCHLPSGHGWRVSLGPLAVQAYRPDRFNADSAAAMG